MTTTITRRETVDAKAFRLTTDVRWQSVTMATVVGDHGEYRVERVGNHWRCNCQWGISRTPDRKHCSHVIAAALSAPTPASVGAVSTPTPPVSMPTTIAPPRRQPVDQAFGDCNCRLANKSELYYNRYQCNVIHRVCGCPWSPPRKSPVRIGPAEPSRQPLAASA